MFFSLLFVFSALLQAVLPWYTAGILCFVLSLGWNRTPKQSLILSAASQSLLWLIKIFYHNQQNEGILLARMAGVFGLQSGWLLVVASVVMMGLLCGLAGLSGALVRNAFLPKRSQEEDF